MGTDDFFTRAGKNEPARVLSKHSPVEKTPGQDGFKPPTDGLEMMFQQICRMCYDASAEIAHAADLQDVVQLR
jgi:hypothetical protein